MIFKPSEKLTREQWVQFQEIANRRSDVESRIVSAWEVAKDMGAITEEDERNSWS